MTQPLVDVVIPVHRVERPIERAVASVIYDEGGAAPLVRAIVVTHGLTAADFGDRLEGFGRGLLVVEHHDGIPSPAGPLNAGIDAATATWVSCMGSDDFLEEGAPAAWKAHVERRNPDVLVLPVVDQASGQIDIPSVRHGRVENLDPIKDRLFYRTGPIMLVRRDLLNTHDIRMAADLRTGEDLAYSMKVWTHAQVIDLLNPEKPCYIEGNDGGERVTHTRFLMDELVAPAAGLTTQQWIADLDEKMRTALTVRIFRHSLIPALKARIADISDEEISTLREAMRAWIRLAPAVQGPLSMAEHHAVTTVLSGATREEIATATAGLSGQPSPKKILPTSLVGLAHPDNRLRHFLVGRARPQTWRVHFSPMNADSRGDVES